MLMLMLWCIECGVHADERIMLMDMNIYALAMMRTEECTCSWDMMLVMLVSMTCLPMQLVGNKRR
jgi:hypothetical protein